MAAAEAYQFAPCCEEILASPFGVGSLQSETPCSCVEEESVMGIDEAGRGPVLGETVMTVRVMCRDIELRLLVTTLIINYYSSLAQVLWCMVPVFVLCLEKKNWNRFILQVCL